MVPRFEATPDILALATGEKGPIGAPITTSAVPLRLDVHVVAPGTLRIENNLARVRASADLRLGGTMDRPQLFGRAEIVRGDLSFEEPLSRDARFHRLRESAAHRPLRRSRGRDTGAYREARRARAKPTVSPSA